ncbi:MAG: hypothetical protein HQK88_02710 [Nitrospirae bacterium]|nr:hypothetical protein [Nitrospirota bacterium]MBF0534309.1 hypothetical protein [Nitrospirota bacterium]MBF0615710.1 hypothetical protein [Nitrospirota bacterium]
MTVITIPRPLREKLGDEGTDAFVEVINKIDTEAKKGLATKEDISNLEIKIESVKAEIEKSKSETLRWLFIFWASQIGIIFALFKFFK